jgi:tetratricopeptide (TPR) repeat protein
MSILAQNFTEVFKESEVLVFGRSKYGVRNIRLALLDNGFVDEKIQICEDFADASVILANGSVRFVVCEYYKGSRDYWGDIFEKFLQLRETVKENVYFILVTPKDSLHIVSEVVEKDIDMIVLKPFNSETFGNLIRAAVERKQYPSEYYQQIDQALSLINKGDTAEAEKVLTLVAANNEKPALAFYYLGEIHKQRRHFEHAKKSYLNGLKDNPYHYHCLVGLFDVLMEVDEIESAYKVVKDFLETYVSSKKHFQEGVKLSIKTEHIEDVDFFMNIYNKIDVKDDMTRKYIWAAMFIAGKFYAACSRIEDAIMILNKLIEDCNYRPLYLRKALEIGLEYQLNEFIPRVYAAFSDGDREDDDFFVAKNLVDYHSGQGLVSYEHCLDLAKEGFDSFMFYKCLLEESIKLSDRENQGMLYKKACEMWPDKKGRLKKFIPFKAV